MKEPVGIDTEHPVVSWKIRIGDARRLWRQAGYRIILSVDLGTVCNSG